MKVENWLEKRNKDIELRSEEVQEVMGQVPAWIVRWGITLLFLVVVALLVGSCFFKYPSFYSRYPRIPLQQAFRHASSASLTAISRPWIWISISTGYIILLSMEMVSDFELSYLAD